MESKILKELILTFNIIDIELELIHQYLDINNIDFSNSKYISNYFKPYSKIKKLEALVKKLNVTSIKDLENCLELLIPTTDRKLNGAFFTPNYIVDFIINDIQPKYDDSNIDLSCGCGAFLVGLADYYRCKYNKSVKQTVKENIFGSDILGYNIERAKIVLSIYAIQYNEILEESDFNLYCIDALKHKWNRKFNNIVGNPPYVKFQDMPEESRAFLSDKWETTSSGAFNLYFAFFELGHKLLGDGKLGYITPNNYFTSLAAEPLRSFLTKNQCVAKIVDFASKKVFDVQTYTAITFISGNNNSEILYDRISSGQKPHDFLKELSYSINQISYLNKKKWRLLKSSERNNIHKIENIGVPIKTMFDICVGIATLKDAVFFIDGDTFDGESYYKRSSNGKTYKIEKEITRSVYKISDFKNQDEIINNKRKIICPYDFSNTVKLLDEDYFKMKFPHCYEYLIAEKAILEFRDKGKKTAMPFYAWGRTQGLSKFGIRLLTPTFSKNPRFLRVDEEDAYFTNGYGIFFKKINADLFDDIHPLSKLENIDIVQKILNSSLMHYYVTCTSVAIEGGYPCYQKNFIEKFTIPYFDDKEICQLRGMKTSKQIDKFLVAKYGLDL